MREISRATKLNYTVDADIPKKTQKLETYFRQDHNLGPKSW